jgi:hypothetical protein
VLDEGAVVVPSESVVFSGAELSGSPLPHAAAVRTRRPASATCVAGEQKGETGKR